VVNDPDDLPDDPHLAEVGFWEMREDAELGMLRMPGIPTGFSDSPGTIRRLAPRLGEHSVEVLREAGLSAARIDRLLAEGVAVQAPPLAARADQADQEEVP
jgi:crotonobetainyl-CoA:carnitine CoA-transferase CaiB-like acyl-CoA transferase